MLCCSDGIPEKEITYLNLATQNKVDGIVALTYSDIGNFINPDIPIVVFDRFFENRNIPRVGSDNYNGSMMAIEKLLELAVAIQYTFVFILSFLENLTSEKMAIWLPAKISYNSRLS